MQNYYLKLILKLRCTNTKSKNRIRLLINPIQTGGGGGFDHPDLNPLLLTNDLRLQCSYFVTFPQITCEQFGLLGLGS